MNFSVSDSTVVTAIGSGMASLWVLSVSWLVRLERRLNAKLDRAEHEAAATASRETLAASIRELRDLLKERNRANDKSRDYIVRWLHAIDVKVAVMGHLTPSDAPLDLTWPGKHLGPEDPDE